MSEKYTKIAVYGSLREGDYNFTRMKNNFGEGSIRKIGQTILFGFKMANLGPYPALYKTEEKEDTVVFDILEVSPECLEFIRQMEVGAGYKEVTISTPLGDCFIYTYIDDLKHFPVIPGGDWIKYCESLYGLVE